MNQNDELKTGRRDYAVSLAKSLVGAAPLAGPLMSEVVGNLIPNQRLDRVIQFVEAIDARLKKCEHGVVEGRPEDTRMLGLIETGTIAAARSISKKRIDYLATVVTEGLTAEQLDADRLDAVIDLVSQISDLQVLILMANSHEIRENTEWWREHSDTVMSPIAHLGSSREEAKKLALHQNSRDGLIRLGLLKPRFKNVSRGAVPEFDPKTGMMQSSGHELTAMGGIILQTLGLIEEPF